MNVIEKYETMLRCCADEVKRVCGLKSAISISYEHWIYSENPLDAKARYIIWVEDTRMIYSFGTFEDILDWITHKEILFKKF